MRTEVLFRPPHADGYPAYGRTQFLS